MTKGKFCRVSFYQLLGNVERYDGRRVEFVGYLGLVDGVPFVFPTEDAMRRWDLASGIELNGTNGVTQGWVLVFGVFSARSQARKDMSLAKLNEVSVSKR
jgi:hypothetical protein